MASQKNPKQHSAKTLNETLTDTLTETLDEPPKKTWRNPSFKEPTWTFRNREEDILIRTPWHETLKKPKWISE